MRKNILLILGIVMFVLTTSLVVLIPQALVFKLDALQWIILAIIMLMGYSTGTLYLMAHFAPEDKLIGKMEEKHK
jgi:cytochrome c biogenesis protein CcdA